MDRPAAQAPRVTTANPEHRAHPEHLAPKAPQAHPGRQACCQKRTETGSWGISGTVGSITSVLATVSFTLPLTAALEPSDVHFVDHEEAKEGTVAGCPGTAEHPAAELGQLCIFEGAVAGGGIEKEEVNGFQRPAGIDIWTPGFAAGGSLETTGAGPTGAILRFAGVEGEPYVAWGSWALTAPKGG